LTQIMLLPQYGREQGKFLEALREWGLSLFWIKHPPRREMQMQHIEFLVLCVLLILLLRRTPILRYEHVTQFLILEKLNRIEAHLRQVETATIDKETAEEIAALSADRESVKFWLG